MNKTESEIRTHFVMNLRDKNFRNLAVTNDWNLKATVAAATRNESMMASTASPATEIAAVSAQRPVDRFRPENRHRSENRYRPNDSNAHAPAKREFAPYRNSTRNSDRTTENRCKDCGIARHRTNVCPAIGKECSVCKKQNHFAAVCPEARPRDRSERNRGRNAKPANVNQVSVEEDWD